MKAHILTIRFTGMRLSIPPTFRSEVVSLLLDFLPPGSTDRYWIDAGHIRLVSDQVAVLEVTTPNVIVTDAVLTAVNRVIKNENPTLNNNDWETRIFTVILCMNQDQ